MTARPWIVLLLAGAVAGCASLSQRQCRDADWAEMGRQDGERGLPVQELERHGEACRAHGITPDAARYREGHARGLASYCTPRGGYRAGRDGAEYRETCAGPDEEKFLEAYRRGREVSYVLREADELRQRARDLELAALQGDYAPAERTQLRFRAEEAGQRLRIKEWELERLDRQYAREYGVPELTWTEMRQ